MPPPSSPLLGVDRNMFTFAISPPPVHRRLRFVSGYKKILYIAGTGEGKSLVFFIPAFYIPKMVIIVVVPLISLMQNMVMRLRDFNIEAVAWDPS
ncbi:hypothetical protein V8F33_013821 [Rhypophila sp. PSN 637]